MQAVVLRHTATIPIRTDIMTSPGENGERDANPMGPGKNLAPAGEQRKGHRWNSGACSKGSLVEGPVEGLVEGGVDGPVDGPIARGPGSSEGYSPRVAGVDGGCSLGDVRAGLSGSPANQVVRCLYGQPTGKR